MFLTVSLTRREAELIMTPWPILIKSFHIIDFTQLKQNIYLIFEPRWGCWLRTPHIKISKVACKVPLWDYDFTEGSSCPAFLRERLVSPLLWRLLGESRALTLSMESLLPFQSTQSFGIALLNSASPPRSVCFMPVHSGGASVSV